MRKPCHFVVIRKRAKRIAKAPKVPAVKLSAEELERLIEAGAGAEAKPK